MQPLIDADVLLYELGWAAEYGKDNIPSFDYVKELVDGRIQGICQAVGATKPPLLFLTGPGNFRDDIAIRKGYKANRVDKPKPFHYANIKAYLKHSYGATVYEGYEADDALAMLQTKDTVICTRDKDLRQVPGYHYSWECGRQGEIPLYEVDLMGEFWEDGLEKKNKELKGTGLRFFFAQFLIGDAVDNIPGLPGCGPVKAYKALKDAQTPEELEAIVAAMYEEKYPDNAAEEMLEQGRLVWMCRSLDENGNPVMWERGMYD